MGSREYFCLVRKAIKGRREQTPIDLLWASVVLTGVNGINWGFSVKESETFFTKPHRTTGLTVQFHSSHDTDTRGVLIVYYDIDDMIKGEATQAMEKPILKGRTRRTFARQ